MLQKLRLPPCHDLILMEDFRPEVVKRWFREHDPGLYVEGRAAGDRFQEANVEVPGHRLHVTMEQTMCHCGIQQRGHHSAMKDAIVALELRVRLEVPPEDIVISRLESQIQRPWVPLAAEEAIGMAVPGADCDRCTSGHKCSHHP